MKSRLPLKFWWLFFCEVVWRLIAWAVIPFTMLFLKKADMSEIQDKIQYGIGADIQRYIFPKWAECVEAPDEYGFPAYEPSMMKLYKKTGYFFTTWWNLSTRNVGLSLSWQLAIPVSDYWVHLSDEEKGEKGLFDNHYRFGNVVLKVGYVSYRNWKLSHGGSKFVATPRVTLRIEKEVKDEV